MGEHVCKYLCVLTESPISHLDTRGAAFSLIQVEVQHSHGPFLGTHRSHRTHFPFIHSSTVPYLPHDGALVQIKHRLRSTQTRRGPTTISIRHIELLHLLLKLSKEAFLLQQARSAAEAH